MAMIYCPECHARISEHASTCPRCGFTASVHGALVPMGELPLELAPACVQVTGIAVFDDGTDLISADAKSRLSSLMQDAGEMAKLAPSIYNAIQRELAGHGTILAADFSKAAMEKMESGELVLNVDKVSGQLLPTLRDVKTGKIYEQARLHQEMLPSNLASSLTNIQTQVSMAEILSEIREVTREIEHLRMEIRADRIGKAKSVWFQLQDAAHIQDARLREQRILDIAGSATEQRYVLQENFTYQLGLARSRGGKTASRGRAAHEALTDLSVISIMAGTEYAAYSLIEEPKAALSALARFNGFIEANRLNKRDTLLELNSVSDENLGDILDRFQNVATSVAGLLSSEEGQNGAGYLPKGGNPRA